MIKTIPNYLSSDGRQHKTLDEACEHERMSKIMAILLLRRATLPSALDNVPTRDIAEAIAATHYETRNVFDQIDREIATERAAAASKMAATQTAQRHPDRFFTGRGMAPKPAQDRANDAADLEEAMERMNAELDVTIDIQEQSGPTAAV